MSRNYKVSRICFTLSILSLGCIFHVYWVAWDFILLNTCLEALYPVSPRMDVTKMPQVLRAKGEGLRRWCGIESWVTTHPFAKMIPQISSFTPQSVPIYWMINLITFNLGATSRMERRTQLKPPWDPHITSKKGVDNIPQCGPLMLSWSHIKCE